MIHSQLHVHLSKLSVEWNTFKVPIVIFSIICFFNFLVIIILQDALEILERHAVYVDSGQRDSRALAFRRAACALKSYPKYVKFNN